MQFFSDVLGFCVTLFESCSVFQWFLILPITAGVIEMSCSLLHFGGGSRD